MAKKQNTNPKGKNKEEKERNHLIFLQWAEYNSSYSKIGKMFGLTRARVGQIIKKERGNNENISRTNN